MLVVIGESLQSYSSSSHHHLTIIITFTTAPWPHSVSHHHRRPPFALPYLSLKISLWPSSIAALACSLSLNANITPILKSLTLSPNSYPQLTLNLALYLTFIFILSTILKPHHYHH